MTSSAITAATARGLLVAIVATSLIGLSPGIAWAEPTPPSIPGFPSFPSPVSFGIGDWIIKQINGWFAALAASAIKPLLQLLGETLLATPQVSSSDRIFEVWQATAVIANSAFALLATIGAVIAMGHQTVQTRYTVKEVLPRLAMAILVTNASFLICGKLIETANALSTALLGQDFDTKRAAEQIQMLLLVPSSTTQIFYILLILVAIILLVLLLISFVTRTALVLLLVVAAPLALACHALPHTEGVARFWWRAITGLLVIQVAQSLTLVMAVRIFFNQDGRRLLGLTATGQLVNLVLVLCLLIILVRIPGWISRRIFSQGGSRSAVVSIVKYALLSKLTSPVLKAVHLRGGRSGGSVGRKAKLAVAGKVVAGAIGGPAGTAAATTLTAVSAARSGQGPAKHAPTWARRPVRAADWEPAPIKHAPTGPAIQGRYKPAPVVKPPVSPTTPVYGYPREVYYSNGPAGLAQMQTLRDRAVSNPRRAVEPPRTQRPVRPIVPPNAPIPGQVEWPENRGRTPDRSGCRARTPRKGGGK
ncbi:conjugal transfer protein TrbL family protein [Nonomuraea sp. NPDC050227]|uniref:conjugal transfer protein TrbL family protein n=1 Tax=Nonomuraea sp. NPDC050227 TaxID=3364360 RepID=UPI003788D423